MTLFVLAGATALALAVLQTFAFRYALYDVGIFHQILWALSHGQGFRSTVSGADHFLADHLAVSLVFLVPFFNALGGGAWALPILHAALVFTGIGAWVYLAANAPGLSAQRRQELAGATTVFALSFDSLWGNLRWGFHETAIPFAALSWAFALTFAAAAGRERARGRERLAQALILVAAFSKETMLPVGAVLFAGYALLSYREHGRPTRGFALSVTLAAALCFVFVVFETRPHPADKNYFNRYYAYLGHGLWDFATTLLLRPWLVFKKIGVLELLKYAKSLALPWLALPGAWVVWSWRSRRFMPPTWLLVSLIPGVMSAALATYPPLRDPGFHYVLELWPALACLTILALARLSSRELPWAWAVAGVIAFGHDPLAQVHEYAAQAFEGRARLELVRTIPPDDSVAATELAGPWVAGRATVTRWPDWLAFYPCPQWLILEDGPQSRPSLSPVLEDVLKTCRTGEWPESPDDGSLLPSPRVVRAGGWVRLQLGL